MGNTPIDSCAIDSLKIQSLLKCYHEYLERINIGFQLAVAEDVMVLNYIDFQFTSLKRLNFGYGETKLFGKVDTTGTAAGLRSDQVVKAGILELIEKNEMLLLWYCKKGVYFKKNAFIKKTIANMAFSSERVEIFMCQEISNYFSIFVVLISQNSVVASGAGISDSKVSALKKALCEARLLEWQNKNNKLSSYYSMNDYQRSSVLKHINKIVFELPKVDFYEEEVKNLEVVTWVKTMYVHPLNLSNSYGPLIVKCISKELYNCVPLKENIINSLDKAIAKKYKLSDKYLKLIPNCILK